MSAPCHATATAALDRASCDHDHDNNSSDDLSLGPRDRAERIRNKSAAPAANNEQHAVDRRRVVWD